MTATKRLDEIEARLSAATPGPWTREQWEAEQPDVPWGADAEFIAHAREDMPALVVAVKAVRALHHPNRHETSCQECLGNWPCPTSEVIDAALDAP